MSSFSEESVTYAISDTHFNTNTDTRDINDFFQFLDRVRNRANNLLLLGDIFDFYFEYKNVIAKDLFNILYEIKKTAESGIKIHYWAGNHDFWLGNFINNLNISVHHDPEIIRIGKKNILIEHGNDINTPRILKKILTNIISKNLFSIIHPDIGIHIARKISALSRIRSEKSNLNFNSFIKYADETFSYDIDAILMGHLHIPYFYKKNNKTLAILGDWSVYRSFAIISNGSISLKRFNQSPR